jgi:RHS repeat-associated protein
VTRNGQSEWTFQYDSAGRMTTATDPLGNAISFTYDEVNRWDVVTFPDGMGSVQFSHDSSGLITRRLYSDGTDIQTSYDERGRKTATENLSLEWDPVNRPLECNGISMTWEPFTNNVKSVTVAPGKSIAYTYDTEGRLASVTDWTGGGVAFTYDDSGRVLTETFANGLAAEYAYDGLGRVLSIDHGPGALSVTRAAGGAITGIENSLPAPAHPGFSDRSFTHNDLNQIEAFTYDALGRRTADDRGTYTYDLADRLTGATRNGVNAVFTHDGNGLLTGVSMGGEDRSYVWNYAFELPFSQIERSGGMDTFYYVSGPGGNLLYRIDALANQAEYYHFDPLGHTRAVSDSQGSLVATYAYSPYGKAAASDPDFHNPFTYVGRYGIIHLPELDLYNMRHRFYDPESRQFLTRDPLYVLPYPATTAPYQYAAGDPLNNIDPTGLAPVNGAVANVNSSTSDGGGWDTASKATGSASLGSFIGQHGGKKLDQLADAANTNASQAQRAHRSLQNVARAAGNAPSVPKILDNAGDFARQANRLDQATDLMRTGSRPLSAVGKAGKLIGPLSIGVEAVRGYKRIGRSIAQTNELLRVTYEAYETRVEAIKEIYLSGKKSEEWFKEQLDANLAAYMAEYNGINDAGLYDSLIGVWVTAGDMIGTLIPGYGIPFGTEEIANFTHKHVWQKIYH